MNDAEEIKNRLDILEVVASYLTLKKAGSNHKANCPFHSEKTPSFMVNPERQIFKCFGCQAGGDIFEFVMKMENLTFPEALRVLADKAGVRLTPRYKIQDTRYQQEEDIKSNLYKINALATRVFHKILLEHPSGKAALDYLKSRGLTEETIKKFQIGFAPQKPVLASFLQQKGFSFDEVSRAGAPDKFRNRIIFPIFDALGSVLGFTGRAAQKDQQPKYFNTPETPIFSKGKVLYGLNLAKQAIKEKNSVVLLEGQMDVVLSHQAGAKNAVASSGTALTQNHLKVIQRHSDNLTVFFDMDDAGEKAALSALELALPLDFNLKVGVLPVPFKDAGEAVQKDAKIFLRAVEEAKYWLDWLIAAGAARIKNAELRMQNLGPTEKKWIAKTVLPFIAKIGSPVERSEATKKLSVALAVSEKSLHAALATVKSEKSKDENKGLIPEILSFDDFLYGLLRINKQEQNHHPDLYKQLQKSYTGDVKQLELAVEEKIKTTDVEVSRKIIEELILRRQSNQKEAVKAEFASQIAQAEEKGDREGVKQLLKELSEKIK